MNLATVGNDALRAAASAAGVTWGQIQHDFQADLEAVLQAAARIEAKLAAGIMTADESEELLRDQARILFVLEKEAEVAAKVVTQNAANAAIDVIWAAVKTAAKIA